MALHTRNEVRAGALMVVGFLLLCFCIYVIADFKTFFAPKVSYRISFDRVEGLKIDDDVLYAGIKCGRVTDIRFQQEDKAPAIGDSLTRVLVTILLDKNVPLTDKDRPRVSRGFTGSVSLDISPWRRAALDEPTARTLAPGDELRGTHYASLSEVADEAKATIVQFRGELGKVGNALDNIKLASEDVRKITGDVRAVVDRNAPKVDSVIAHADKTVENTEAATQLLRDDARAFMVDARDAIARAKDVVVKAQAKIEEALPKFTAIVDKIDASADSVKSATAKVDTAADDVKVVTTNVRDLVVANRPNIDGTLEQLRQSAGRLNLAMEDIRRNPWKLLSRNVESDAYTQNIYDASLAFADGARALAQTSATLNALAAQPGVDPEAVRKQTETVTQLVTEMSKLEQALYAAMKNRPK